MTTTRIRRSLATLVVALACTAPLAAQQPAQPPTPIPAPDPTAEIAARRERIRAEVAELGEAHAWAGSYYLGDGLGVNVSVDLAPKSGFAFTWSGCMGVYDQNHGSVQEKDGELALTFDLPSERKGAPGLASTLIPVAWGKRHYLVAGDGMQAFANEINGGMEPRNGVHGDTLLRRGDEQKKVQGMPTLPKEFACLLLEKPIEGQIVAVRDTRVEKGEVLSRRFTTVVIDRGSKHGMREGMRLFLTTKNGHSSSVKVTKVEAQTALADVVTFGDAKDKAPAEGWTWSTRASWAR